MWVFFTSASFISRTMSWWGKMRANFAIVFTLVPITIQTLVHQRSLLTLWQCFSLLSWAFVSPYINGWSLTGKFSMTNCIPRIPSFLQGFYLMVGTGTRSIIRKMLINRYHWYWKISLKRKLRNKLRLMLPREMKTKRLTYAWGEAIHTYCNLYACLLVGSGLVQYAFLKMNYKRFFHLTNHFSQRGYQWYVLL